MIADLSISPEKVEIPKEALIIIYYGLSLQMKQSMSDEAEDLDEKLKKTFFHFSNLNLIPSGSAKIDIEIAKMTKMPYKTYPKSLLLMQRGRKSLMCFCKISWLRSPKMKQHFCMRDVF